MCVQTVFRPLDAAGIAALERERERDRDGDGDGDKDREARAAAGGGRERETCSGILNHELMQKHSGK